MSKFHIGQNLWLNQGVFPAVEVLNISGQYVAVHVPGWCGRRHWFNQSQLLELHPVTNKTVARRKLKGSPPRGNIVADVNRVIHRAAREGMTIDGGNVIDLLADNIPVIRLSDLRTALAASEFAGQWPEAEKVP